MKWEGGRREGNIEDRRGMSGGARAAGGIGLGGLVVVLIGVFVFHIDPNDMLSMVSGGGNAPVSGQQGVRGSPTDKAAQFVDVVETSTTDVWSDVFARSGRTYQAPAGVVIYDRATSTECGTGQAAMGPFYCPNDRKVYLDLAFWNELETRFGAKGDFAKAYVIAHEIGHGVQNQLGAMDESKRLGARGAESGSVRLELQADCYAGVWAARAGQVSNGAIGIDGRDIADGMAAASAVGDDTLQQKTQGQVVPDSFTHGTSEQRMRWFQKGAENGDPADCDTFRAAAL
jgi:predicted metalloprotease